MASFNIGNLAVGDDFPPLVIAEIGINHGGSLDVAIDMADAAINAGAQIIKHQTHVVEDEMSSEAKIIIPPNADKSIYQIMEDCSLSETDEKKLMNYVNDSGAVFISTPFSRSAADRLKRFDIPAFKIGSGECNNYPLIEHIAKFRKPIILSTGMNSLDSIEPAVRIFRKYQVPYALLHCTNIYPTPEHLVRLGAISILKNRFPDAVVGLSDHTISNYTCFGAVALGASILERHFTDSMSRVGPDIECSMDPLALRDLISGSKVIFSARGGDKVPLSEENKTIAFAFASVVAVKDIAVGELITRDNIWLRRPAGGDFSVTDFESLIGKKAGSFIKSGNRLKKSDIQS
jgi:N-acetylneuraminate synthase